MNTSAVMRSKFDMEQPRVGLLMQRLGFTPDKYLDPSTRGAGETGADVIAVINGHRVGVQVTDLDTGEEAGKARDKEVRLARDAESRDTTYGTWAQNDLNKIIIAIGRSLTRKTRMSFAG